MTRGHGDSVMVVGAGAMGLVLAAYLSHAGHGVTVLTHGPEQADAVNACGITVEHEGRTWTERAARARPFGHGDGEADWILMAVKSHHVPSVLAGWPEALRAAAVVTIQNGLVAARLLTDFFGPERVVAAATPIGAARLGPARVRQAGTGDTLVGPLHPAGRSLAESWASHLRRAGLGAVSVDDGHRALWTKAAVNAAVNPLATVMGLTNGQLGAAASWHWLMRAAVDEVREVAGRSGISLRPDLFSLVMATLAQTASNRCSMLEDVLAGRPTELDAITGEVLRRGRELGVRMPANEALYHLMQARLLYSHAGEATQDDL